MDRSPSVNIRPYGDTKNDGKIQISFTLPLKNDALGEEAAKALAAKMGVPDAHVTHRKSLDEQYTFYILYGTLTHVVDPSTLHVPLATEAAMTKEEVEAFIAGHFQEEIVFIGASTGTDAHTVGIDAIMNMKGYAGHYGLERYSGVRAINLGSQVDNERLLEEALKHEADVILISQTVTQKNIHIQNLTAFIELLEAEGRRDDFLVVVGGARINHALAKELGYDAGFGPKQYAADVASFCVVELHRRGRKTFT